MSQIPLLTNDDESIGELISANDLPSRENKNAMERNTSFHNGAEMNFDPFDDKQYESSNQFFLSEQTRNASLFQEEVTNSQQSHSTFSIFEHDTDFDPSKKPTMKTEKRTGNGNGDEGNGDDNNFFGDPDEFGKLRKNNVDIDDALEATTSGIFQIFLLLLCGSGYFFDGIELALIPFIIPILQDEWNLSPTESGLLGSSVFIGMMVGAFFGGLLSDRFGRKVIFCLATLLTTALGLISAFSPNFFWLFFFRCGTGVGLGASLPTDYTMLMEWRPSRSRGRILSILNIFSGIGSICESLLAVLIIQGRPERWRILVLASSIPGILIVLLRYILVPESPRWLIAKGYQDEILDTFRHVCKIGGLELPRGWALADGTSKVEFVNSDMNGHKEDKIPFIKQISELFTKYYRLTTICLLPIWFLLSIGGWGYTLLLPTLLDRVKTRDPYFTIGVIAFLSGTSFIFIIALIDYFPRKFFLFFGFLSTGIVMSTLGLFPSTFYIIVIATVSQFCNTFPWSVLYLYTTEVYDTRIRTTAIGIASTFTRFGGIITPIIGFRLLEYGNLYPFLFYGVALAMAAVISLILPYETLKKKHIETTEGLQYAKLSTSTNDISQDFSDDDFSSKKSLY